MSEVVSFYTIPTPLNPSEWNETTLWDYYAAAALTGVSVNEAARCVDAMLEERAKRTEAES